MQLCIPYWLFQPIRIGKLDLAKNAVAVRRNEGRLRRVSHVAGDENDALDRIVCQLVCTAVGCSIAKRYGVTNPWRAHIEINCLQKAVAVSDPKKIVGRHDDTVRTSAPSVGPERSDKAWNRVDVYIVHGIDDVDSGLASVRDIKPSCRLIDPQYVYSADASGNRDCGDRIDRTTELHCLQERYSAYEGERE